MINTELQALIDKWRKEATTNGGQYLWSVGVLHCVNDLKHAVAVRNASNRLNEHTMYPHTKKVNQDPDETHSVLCCNRCGKSVSSPFMASPTDTPDRGLIVRAWIECPECFAKEEMERYAKK